MTTQCGRRVYEHNNPGTYFASYTTMMPVNKTIYVVTFAMITIVCVHEYFLHYRVTDIRTNTHVPACVQLIHPNLYGW